MFQQKNPSVVTNRKVYSFFKNILFKYQFKNIRYLNTWKLNLHVSCNKKENTRRKLNMQHCQGLSALDAEQINDTKMLNVPKTHSSCSTNFRQKEGKTNLRENSRDTARALGTPYFLAEELKLYHGGLGTCSGMLVGQFEPLLQTLAPHLRTQSTNYLTSASDGRYFAICCL